MVILIFGLVFFCNALACFANTCDANTNEPVPTSLQPDFVMYKKTCLESQYMSLDNDSTLFTCEMCEHQCMVLWCVSSYQSSYDNGQFTMTYTVAESDVATWIKPSPSAMPLPVMMYLCTHNSSAMNCMSYSGYSGAYKCVHNDGNETLKFELDVPTTTVISTIITSTMPCSIKSLHEVTTCSNFLYTSMLQHESIASSLSLFVSPSTSTTVSPVQSPSTLPHYTGIGLLVATNLLTIIALISSCVYIFCQRKKSKFIVTENEQISLQNTSPQTEAT
ncbi:PREDICTED: uncharacterized protein LOC109591403, partial [Amphimedon queenslandica]|uniref:Uncharacterized protein n=1 Tax=Amphimedon queenslandica TaxID=400682 RepID=A0AAN0K011_AMPQE